MTSLPQFFNNILAVFPDWWMSIYPLTYYFIGAYIKEYQVKINKTLAGVLFALTILAEVLITILFSKGGDFSGVVGNYGSIIILLGSVLFFLIFYNADIKNGAVKGFIAWISILSLDIYLCSYITDRLVYKYVMANIFVSQQQILYYMVFIVPATFLSAALISLCRYKSTKLGKRVVGIFKNTDRNVGSQGISQ
jgi:surface polysaccharide O-acyltransferase-like enzyme